MSELVHYFVTDIETDGPDCAKHSMLSFATVVVRQDGTICGEFEAAMTSRADRTTDPRTMDWWATQPEAWEAATSNAEAPEKVMTKYADWIESFEGKRAFAARPLMFDGIWIDRYLRDFAGCFVLDVAHWGRCLFNESPLDIGTFMAGVFGRVNMLAGNHATPEDWLGDHKHTHRAIDDARGYASVLQRLLRLASQRPRLLDDYLDAEPVT
ncbi:3'-5' exoribonuclease domain-containing protein [Rhizobium sp. PAMB 3174]